jgi:hypothetical protein
VPAEQAANGRFAAAGFGPVLPIFLALPDHRHSPDAAATCASDFLN